MVFSLAFGDSQDQTTNGFAPRHTPQPSGPSVSAGSDAGFCCEVLQAGGSGGPAYAQASERARSAQ